MAAGYDKNAEVPDAILGLGFDFVEIGTVTPKPQSGNPRPRIFRLQSAAAVINRLGFNNQGHDAVRRRLENRRRNPGVVGVNIGANKDATDMIADYEAGISAFWNVATYFTANISSPNTPGLRDLQGEELLRRLLYRVLSRRDAMARETGLTRPVFLKIAPDLDQSQIAAVASVVSASALDGLIISNTTTSRTGVEGLVQSSESGGLSGRPLFERSTIVLARMRSLVGDKLPIIGVGGIEDAAGALAKLEAGANLLQLYTGMIFQGPEIANAIHRGLLAELERRGLPDIGALTGTKTSDWAGRRLPGEAK
jgi:dihydroorotate dehydrogenase